MVMGFASDAALTNFFFCPEFEFGDGDDYNRGQDVKETAGGYLAVTDRGYYNRTKTGLIKEIKHAERILLARFFRDTCEGSLNTFWIIRYNERSDESWNQSLLPLRVGSYIDSAKWKVGQTILGAVVDVGMDADLDSEYIGPCRLTKPGVKFITNFKGISTMSFSAVIERAGD